MIQAGFIGFGNMASKIVQGFLKENVLPASAICACAAHYDKLCANAAKYGITPMASAREVVEASNVIIIAVKPYMVESVMSGCLDLLGDKMVISLAAGMPFEKLHAIMPNAHCISVMPNTPIGVGQGILICETTNSLTDDQKAILVRLFENVATIVPVDSAHLSIAGTIAGCSPAFAAMFIEALADAGVKYGLQRAMAYELAAKVLEGTGALYMEERMVPAAMKDAVCSPGGTTIKGVCALEKDGFRAAIIGAIEAIEGQK